MIDYKIERVKETELEHVHKIHQKTFPDFYTLDNWKEYYDTRKHFYVLKHEKFDRVIGFIVAQINVHKRLKVAEGHLMFMGIDPDYQNKGLSKILMNHLFLKMSESNITYLVLEVRTHNIKAINLYFSYDFTIDKYEHKYYKNSDDAFIMRTWVKEKRYLEQQFTEKMVV